MIALLRAALLGFVVLTVVYLLVSVYSRSVRRERLEKDWDTDPANEGRLPDERAAFIEQGMEAYRHSLRRRLIVLVYVIPLVTTLVTVYLVNVN
jgi:Ca2+/Na+ antiporter